MTSNAYNAGAAGGVTGGGQNDTGVIGHRLTSVAIGTVLAALVCVAAAVATPSKLRLRIDAVSHTATTSGSFICARISGTPGASLLVEAYGAGLAGQHAFTEALLPRAGVVVVGFDVAAVGPYRIKVTGNKKKVGRTVVKRDYVVPDLTLFPRGSFACA